MILQNNEEHSYRINSVIPHPVASEHRWLVKASRWIHSVPDVSDRRPICKHCFSALPIDTEKSSVGAQIGLLWRSFCSSSYQVWD